MTEEIPQSMIASSDIELVCIADPAKIGSMAHAIMVVELLWNFPLNNSKLYANRKKPSAIPIANSRGESKKAYYIPIVNATPRTIIDTVQSFLFGKSPHGFVFPPTASSRWAETPSARK